MDIWPENEDAWLAFQLVYDQVITTDMGYIIATKHEAIWRLVDELEFDDSFFAFQKILYACKIYNDLHNKEIEKSMKAKIKPR